MTRDFRRVSISEVSDDERNLSLGARFVHRTGEYKQLVHFRGLQHVQESLRSPDDDEFSSGVLARDMGTHEATYPGRIDVRHIRDVNHKQVRLVAPHHRLEAEKVTQQQRAVQAENDTLSARVIYTFDFQRLFLHTFVSYWAEQLEEC